MTTNKKPVIGIPYYVFYEYVPLFDTGVQKRLMINYPYIHGIARNGGVPCLLMPVSEGCLQEQMEAIDGLLLPGGCDVDPALYGEEPHRDIGVYRPELDSDWVSYTEQALKRGLPIFGICRGMQFLNVFFGGSLFQDLLEQKEKTGQTPGAHVQKGSRTLPTHSIRLQQDSLLYSILQNQNAQNQSSDNPKENIRVNSLHHQSVKTLGKGVLECGWALDGTIEAIENKEQRLLGVQWHPEELLDTVPAMNALFSWLIQESGKTRS
ncbi:MAG: gamma-glutamyl-gamma-aminobutyrate hydrolase family protein [Lachnospiraceae bacterium]|nr:gamma-glutamyl-gamma-aminobutyrate hydrolase family protein [Lachnospiraceae bacterium]